MYLWRIAPVSMQYTILLCDNALYSKIMAEKYRNLHALNNSSEICVIFLISLFIAYLYED